MAEPTSADASPTAPSPTAPSPTAPKPAEPILAVTDLSVTFGTEDGPVRAVRGVSFDVAAGEVLAVVGESGSGKSVTALSLLGLLPPGAEVTGSVRWEGRELLGAPAEALRQVRGAEIAMIFQDPLTALNPVHRIGRQITETIEAHERVSGAEAQARAVDLLGAVGMAEPERRVRQYPHELSGGMRQRAMIAMALACGPRLLIADEPTTALDVTVQAQVMELLASLAAERAMAIVLITHDLGVVAGAADRVAVMYAGRVVEVGSADAAFGATAHPYTAALLASLPRLDAPAGAALQPIEGQPPSMLAPPPGCAFAPRCPYASVDAGCTTVVPELVAVGDDPGHLVACVRHGDVALRDLRSAAEGVAP